MKNFPFNLYTKFSFCFVFVHLFIHFNNKKYIENNAYYLQSYKKYHLHKKCDIAFKPNYNREF